MLVSRKFELTTSTEPQVPHLHCLRIIAYLCKTCTKAAMKMTTFKDISTLIFDFGGVIVDLDMNRSILEFKKLGFHDVAKYLGNFGQSGFFLAFEKGEIDTCTFRNEIRKNTTQQISDSQIDHAWNAFLVAINTEKLHWLMQLRTRFRVVMLSNTNSVHFSYAESKLFPAEMPLSSCFDTCYKSYEMGMVKPHEAIFKALLAAENVNVEHCLFLDDGIKNIEQAYKLGMQTFHVNTEVGWSSLMNPQTFQ
jgi:putative hydrolase of the HAD superfamily